MEMKTVLIYMGVGFGLIILGLNGAANISPPSGSEPYALEGFVLYANILFRVVTVVGVVCVAIPLKYGLK